MTLAWVAPHFGFNEAWHHLGTTEYDQAEAVGSNTARYPFDWVAWRDSLGYRVQFAGIVSEFTSRGIAPILCVAGTDRPNLSEYADVAAEIAGLYQDDVLGIEIWNEPNSVHYGNYGPAGYAAMLHEARAAIALTAPEVTICSGGPAPTGNWRRFLKKLSREPGDWVLGAHIYPSLPGQGTGSGKQKRGPRSCVEPTRRYMNAVIEAATVNRKDRVVWVTECGLSSGTLGATRQRAMMPYYLRTIGKRARVRVVIVHRLKDRPEFFPDSEWEQGLGVIDSEGVPKPVWSVFT